ncbi:hypothetical protein PWT90_10596 [Aphanocladium album]|nr:hypothetical protein PWT90_10596 [Aphanocladium album]
MQRHSSTASTRSPSNTLRKARYNISKSKGLSGNAAESESKSIEAAADHVVRGDIGGGNASSTRGRRSTMSCAARGRRHLAVAHR